MSTSSRGRILIKSKVYLEKYEVFENGDIYSLRGKYKKLKSFINKCGYYDVYFYFNGKRIKKKLHRVIAELFCKGFDETLVVNHIDGNKENNCALNLEWVTSQENRDHACRTGLQAKGTKIGTNKLSEDDVRQIRQLLLQGISGTNIAKQFDISHQMVYNIRDRKYWAWL